MTQPCTMPNTKFVLRIEERGHLESKVCLELEESLKQALKALEEKFQVKFHLEAQQTQLWTAEGWVVAPPPSTKDDLYIRASNNQLTADPQDELDEI